MKRHRKTRLSIDKETLRRVAGNDLAQVAGGKIGARCTYEQTGCVYQETMQCPSHDCPNE